VKNVTGFELSFKPPYQYSLSNKIGNNSRSFTSSESFTDTYIVNVDGSNNLTIDVHANDGSTKYVAVYVVGPVDNTQRPSRGQSVWKSILYNAKPFTPINVNVVVLYWNLVSQAVFYTGRSC